MARRFWTPARIAELRGLWRAGQTAAAIGKALGGVSRSAVLGQLFRLRLAPGVRRGAAPQANHDAPARRRAGKAPPQPAPTKARRKTLLDLTNECCRWPYGELGCGRFFFCGAAGADVARGMPYCPRHMQRAYIVPPSLVKPSLAKPNLATPLHELVVRAPAKLSSADDSAFHSLPRQRESRTRKFG